MSEVPETIVIGATGFIGRYLLAAYRQVHPATVGTTRCREETPGLAYLDLEKPELKSLPLERCRFQAAIIAGAVTRVDECERDPAGSRRVNVTGTLRLIEQLHDHGLLPIFLSSDYVFDGRCAEGYADDAPLCPNTEYGRHKAEVEKALRDGGKPYLLLRLSKMYGTRRGDGTLLDEMASRLASGRSYRAAHDQIFNPTWVEDLPRAIMTIQGLGLRGVFNLCAPQAWSRYDLCLAVARELGLPKALAQRVSLDELPGSVKRPKSTRLVPARLARETDIRFAPVEVCLQLLAREIREGS
jgi:dTDP-4-dehydrorhamnose reductase